MRYILTIGIMMAIAAWLVLSYAPASLPVIAFPGAQASAWFGGLAALSLAVFALIQGWLVYATGRLLRRPATADLRQTVEQFHLSVGREVFWTALPLLITVVMAAAILVNLAR